MSYRPTNQPAAFAGIPANAELSMAWPTDNRALFTNPSGYFASTRANPDYGRPGWTRDGGRRFHRGCDIAPVNRSPDGKTHRVMFTDLQSGREYPADEPGWIPHDFIYSVSGGVVVECDPDTATPLGRHVIVEHRWGEWGAAFYSLYAHLDRILVGERDLVTRGQTIATMGMTSSLEGAIPWMAIAPHLHLEFWNDAGESLNPEEVLYAFIERT